MNPSERDKLPLTSKAEAALLQAAKKAIQEAERTGTPVIVWENGKVAEVPAGRLEVEQDEDETTE